MTKKNTKLTYADFDLYKWQRFPLTGLYTDKIVDQYTMNLSEIQNGEPQTACVLTTLSVWDSYYIAYAYHYNGQEFAFAWETYSDEIHRAYSKDTTTEFYDVLNQNYNFEIMVDPKNPKQHYITAPNLKPMNMKVIFLDPKIK